MNSPKWIDLLGRSSEDEEVRAALAETKVKEVPPIKKDGLDVRFQLDDVMLVFSDPELFPDLAEGGEGTSVLSGVLLPLKGKKWGEFQGLLPLNLNRDDSRAKLRNRFGEPDSQHENFRWDQWRVGDRLLKVEYDKELTSLGYVMISLPPHTTT
jgi:hypothetical protein